MTLMVTNMSLLGSLTPGSQANLNVVRWFRSKDLALPRVQRPTARYQNTLHLRTDLPVAAFANFHDFLTMLELL